MSAPPEVWLPIPGHPGYEASDLGRIRPTRPRYSRGRGSVLRPWVVNRHGRLSAYVTLYVGGRRLKRLVHRLVALAHHGPPPDGMGDCCHRNHDSMDNRAANLRWNSHAANVAESHSDEASERRARWEEQVGVLPATHHRVAGVPF